ncbi:hypothetical protein NC651_036160 [Populus alba x Populus x berolinensis]|nr:hypothetical protein NC651_036160 [Populus alba x Populus x berolinensis]
MVPEIYNDEIFDRSVDAYSFGMLEGVQPFHPITPEEAVKLMCLEKKRPPFKIKVRSYPPDLKELIDECWHSEPVVRPTFSEIITRLDKEVTGEAFSDFFKKRKLGTRPRIFVDEINSFGASCCKLIIKGTNN